MKKISIVLVLLIACLIITGCTTKKSIAVVTPAEINFNSGAALKIISAPEEKNIEWLVKAVENEIKKDSKLKLDVQNPDFYVVLSYKYDYDAGKSYKIISKTAADKNTRRTVHSKEKLNYSTAAAFVQCVLYDAKKLAPVNYFNISAYDGQINAKNSDAYKKEFSSVIVNTISKKLTTQKRAVDVMRPGLSGGFQLDGLCDAFDEGDAAKVKELSKGMPKSFDDFIAAVKKGEYKDDVDVYLPDYYLIIVAQEFDNVSISNLKNIRRQLSEIIKYTDKDTLAKSAADSIGRIDKKIATLQGK